MLAKSRVDSTEAKRSDRRVPVELVDVQLDARSTLSTGDGERCDASGCGFDSVSRQIYFSIFCIYVQSACILDLSLSEVSAPVYK